MEDVKVHQMRLRPEYFDFIRDGTKRIELRLYDEKRRRIGLGDVIEFSKSEEEKLRAEVVGLLRYGAFADLVADFDIAMLADDSRTKTELLEALDGFYTREEQERCGVVGIRFRLI